MQLGKSRPTDRQTGGQKYVQRDRERERRPGTHAVTVAAAQLPSQLQHSRGHANGSKPASTLPSWSRLDAPLAHKRVASLNFISPAPALLQVA